MPNLPVLKCSGCASCIQICSQKAISLVPDEGGFLYPIINDKLCTDCRLCERSCPVLGSDDTVSVSQRESYAAICNDEKVRLESSSGGVFTVLAQEIIGQGGIVFGAEFDNDFSVRQNWTDCIEGIDNFRGSKYLQSRTEDTFIQCRKFLEEGRKVLYTGTPCQIAGLKSFIKKDYDNLYTVDLICHGVPGPKLWQKYIKYREVLSASRTVKTAFRRKDDGWKLFSLSFTFVNDSEYRQPLTVDKYMQLFLHDNTLRESCYQCPFRGDSHKADLTLADFWGVDKILSEMFDDKGCSLVIIQNPKGQKLFNVVKNQCRVAEVDFSKSIESNTAYYQNKKRPDKREYFYKDFDKKTIDFLYKKYGRTSLIRKCASYAKRTILKWIKN